jgi:hypothetical protein
VRPGVCCQEADGSWGLGQLVMKQCQIPELLSTLANRFQSEEEIQFLCRRVSQKIGLAIPEHMWTDHLDKAPPPPKDVHWWRRRYTPTNLMHDTRVVDMGLRHLYGEDAHEEEGSAARRHSRKSSPVLRRRKVSSASGGGAK